MFEFEDIKSYIEQLDNGALFNNLSPEDKEKAIFTSSELLKDYFPIDKLTIRAIALQVLYSIEGEEEEYAKLKRHGVTHYSVKGVSVQFDGSGISPAVVNLIVDTSKAKVKGLI